MRGALSYILLTKFKNQLKAILKSPGKLIYFIIIIALIGFTIFAGKMDDGSGRKLRDINELFCIVLGLYTVMFIILSVKGFSSGASMFSMADVNMIFTGPYKPHKVLVYGLFQQLGTSLMFGLFILFQYTTIHTNYGGGIGTLLIICAGYALSLIHI